MGNKVGVRASGGGWIEVSPLDDLEGKSLDGEGWIGLEFVFHRVVDATELPRFPRFAGFFVSPPDRGSTQGSTPGYYIDPDLYKILFGRWPPIDAFFFIKVSKGESLQVKLGPGPGMAYLDPHSAARMIMNELFFHLVPKPQRLFSIEGEPPPVVKQAWQEIIKAAGKDIGEWGRYMARLGMAALLLLLEKACDIFYSNMLKAESNSPAHTKQEHGWYRTVHIPSEYIGELLNVLEDLMRRLPRGDGEE